MTHDRTDSNARPAPVRSWAPGRLRDDVLRSIDRLSRADDVRRVAVMPDVHLGQDICVGVAFATARAIYPDAVGGDIGCGMAAVALDAPARPLSRHRLAELHRAIAAAVPIHRQRRESAAPLSAFMPDPAELSTPALRALAERDGPIQLGTLGTGNHFLELQRDEEGRLWLMVHSGSRALGQAIRAAHLANAEPGSTGLKLLDAETPAGRAYLEDMRWARRFAAASRREMLLAAGAAAAGLCAWSLDEGSYLDCDHNHVEREEHFGEPLYIHRKGAMPAHVGAAGLVPGSMAAPSYHVRGRGEREALRSSAHGAGRAMSRSQARARISRDQILRELRDVYADPRAAAGLREEAPSAYKDIRDVMRAQRDLVRIERVLTPVMTHKAVGR